MKTRVKPFGFFLLIAALTVLSLNCGKNKSEPNIEQLTNINTGTLPPPTGTGSSTGTGTGEGDLRFSPEDALASPSEVVNFQLVGGVPPYQLGFRYESDCQSWPSYTQAQGAIDPYSGAGWYQVGGISPATDRLCALDSGGQEAYITISVSGSTGTGTGTGTGTSTGTGTGTGTGTTTGTNTNPGTEFPATVFCCTGFHASGYEKRDDKFDGELRTYDYYIAWVKFDISMIDPSAKIYDVAFHYYVNDYGPGDELYANAYFTHLDPQTYSGSILDGTHSSFDKVSSTYGTGWKSERLGSSHESYLEDAISRGQGYITIALRAC
ncbi:MAG: hypothetical protein ACYS8W_11580 [Planctomycetota bacterium]|jgi:hypothetical protein